MRKGRGSTKVPGVKLKAVPSNASSKRRIDDSYSDNDERDPLGDMSVNETKPPFVGIVICCTGIKDKNVLFEQAKILGATTSKDFTVSVTHLIADGPGSAKYQCALERRIPIMDSKWVANTYARWQNGESLVLQETIETHRLLPFIGLKIAITGENDVTRRTELAKLIQRHGGSYSKQLNHNVTHLVVCCKSESAANESEKVKWARAANMERKKSGVQYLIQLIWEEWLFDSIDWQGKWEEPNYRIENPRPSRKILPEQEAHEPFFDPPSFRDCTTSTQRPKGSNPFLISSADPGPSRLAQSSGGSRATLGPDGEDQPEIAQIRRDHPSRPKDVLVNRLWADIVSDAKVSSNDLKGKGKAVIRPRRIAVGDDTEDEEELGGGLPAAGPTNDGDGEIAQRPSYLAKMKSSRELAFAAPSNPVRRPQIAQSKPLGRPESGPPEEGKVFTGLKFLTLGQAARDVAVKALEENGGVVIRDASDGGMEEIDYVIVRLHEAPQFVSSDDPHFSKYRTECWVEHSIWEERLCEASEQIGFTPLAIATPVPGAGAIRLSYSGLDSSQVMTVKRVCRALGINVPDIFSKTVTHLICPSREGAKYDKALSWNIEVVDMDWLWEIARSGRVEGETSETVEHKQQSPIADITNTSSGEMDSRRSDSKTEEDKTIKPSPSKAISSESTGVPARLLSVSPSKGLAAPIPSPSTLLSPNPGSTTPSASASSAQLTSAIAAMLGKRSSGEQEQGTEPPKKKSKRPARTRNMIDGNRLSASVSPARLGTSFVPPIHTMPETAFDELQEELGADSMLVSYEDPAQKAQKMKIMAMIKGETAPQQPVAGEEERRRRLPRKSRNAVSGA
ncbi:hypothetical protein FRC00_004533 [Tulasnella sp. 408]|nr:hypothetical protein FRC00_004533 [Tulasnella sp. 408]